MDWAWLAAAALIVMSALVTPRLLSPAHHRRPSPARTEGEASAAKPRRAAEPCLGPAATWVWTNRTPETTSIWVREGSDPPRCFFSVGGESMSGVHCGYRSSPDQRWLLMWWWIPPTGVPHWLLWDRLENGFRRLKTPHGRTPFSEPVWTTDGNIVFLEQSGNRVYSAWRCDPGTGEFRRVLVWRSDTDWDDTRTSYYRHFDTTLREQSARLKSLPLTFINTSDPLSELVSALPDTGYDFSAEQFGGAIYLPGGKNFVVLDPRQGEVVFRSESQSGKGGRSTRLVVRINPPAERLSGVRALNSHTIYFTRATPAPRAYRNYLMRRSDPRKASVAPIPDLDWPPSVAPAPAAEAVTYEWDIHTGRLTRITTGYEDALYLEPLTPELLLPPGRLRVYLQSKNPRLVPLGGFASGGDALAGLRRYWGLGSAPGRTRTGRYAVYVRDASGRSESLLLEGAATGWRLVKERRPGSTERIAGVALLYYG